MRCFPSSSLDTPAIEYSGQVCVRFFYSMHGPGVGSLFVLTSSSGVKKLAFTRSHDQGIPWHEAAVSTRISKNGKVDRVFEMTRDLLARD